MRYPHDLSHYISLEACTIVDDGSGSVYIVPAGLAMRWGGTLERFSHTLMMVDAALTGCSFQQTMPQGVCRTEANRVIFCDGALPGEQLLTVVTEEKKGEPDE